MKGSRNYYFVLICLVLSMIIGVFTSYKVVSSKYGYLLDLYPSEEYAYLDEVANEVINEGVSIDLLTLSDKKLEYKIENNNDTITLTIYSDSNTFTSSPYVTIKLSNDYRIISKSPNFSSEQEYIDTVQTAIVIRSFYYGIPPVIISWVAFVIIREICISVLSKHLS